MKTHSGSIQKRIIAITLSCILGMCMIISCVSYYIFQNYLQHSLIQSTETSLQLLSDNINSSMNDIYQMARFCQTNGDIADYIAQNPNPGPLPPMTVLRRNTVIIPPTAICSGWL